MTGLDTVRLSPCIALRELLERLGAVEFTAGARRNVSDAVSIEMNGTTLLAVVADERTRIAFVELLPSEPGRAWTRDLYPLLVRANKDFEVSRPDRLEIDLEGASFANGHLYVAGSASLKRRRPDPEDSPKKARKKLREVVRASGGNKRHSDFMLRLRLEFEGQEPRLELDEVLPLRSMLKKIRALAPFAKIPSKDNGIDVEGLETRQGFHYIGLRGPVLRGHAVIVRAQPDLGDPRPFFLRLGGGGIRALRYVAGPPFGPGFLIVAGPVMDGPGPFDLYRWDGRSDAFAGPGDHLELLGRIPVASDEGKVETVFEHAGALVALLDGPDGGDPRILEL